jgi:1-acyl-sn-glycerol-3-phosphate acyltransferase
MSTLHEAIGPLHDGLPHPVPSDPLPTVGAAPFRAPARSRLEQCRMVAIYAAGFTVMTLGAVAMPVVALLTLFQARRFYCEVMAAGMARVGLWMAGIKMVVHHRERIPVGQVVYVANHWSTLDVFLLLALRLPNARFFLSGHLRRKLPMAVIGYLVGVFWTVPQRFPERRVKIFQRADRILRRTGESVFASPEGNQGQLDILAPFNKGAFHLATSLRAPMVPFYINIPRAMNPGWGYNYRPGVVEIHFQPPIATADWRLDELDKNRAAVRERFLEWQQQLQT